MESILENTTKKCKKPEFPKLMKCKYHATVVLFRSENNNGTVVWANKELTFYKVGDYSIHWDIEDFVEFEDQQIILKN